MSSPQEVTAVQETTGPPLPFSVPAEDGALHNGQERNDGASSQGESPPATPNHSQPSTNTPSQPDTSTLSPSTTEEKSDVSGVVSQISLYASQDQHDRLRFVATHRDFLSEEQVKGKTPQAIYIEHLATHTEIDKTKDGKMLAVTVFRYMLHCAGIGTSNDTEGQQSRVKELDSFCLEGEELDVPDQSFLSTLRAKFESRRNLLAIGDDIISDKEHNVLGEVLKKFKEEELGGPKTDIKTPLALFRSLLRNTPSLLDTLQEKVDRAKETLQSSPGTPNSVEVVKEGGKHPDPVSSTPKITPSSSPSQGSLAGDPHRNKIQLKQPKFTGKCTRPSICTSAVFIGLGAALLVVCVALSVHFGRRSSKSTTQEFSLYRESTMLVGGEPIDNVITDRIRFKLYTTDGTRAELCYLDCTNIPPPTRSLPIDITRNSTTMQGPSTPNGRRLVQFFVRERNSFIPEFDSTYMVGGSVITFSTDHIRMSIKLHVFNNLMICTMFLFGENVSSYRSFELNSSNGYTANFTIPPDQVGSQYCAVWVFQDQEFNDTFQYRIKGVIEVYDTSVTGVTCVDLIDLSTPCDSARCYDFFVTLAFSFEEMCVFLSQTSQNSSLRTMIQTFSTLKNPRFGFPIGFSIFLLLLVMFLVLLIVFCVWYHCHKVKTYEIATKIQP